MAVAVISLVASLAGRTFGQSAENHVGVRTGSASAKLQHLDRDSHDWSATVPVARFEPARWRVMFIHVPAPEEPVVVADVQSSLYNRPPPAC